MGSAAGDVEVATTCSIDDVASSARVCEHMGTYMDVIKRVNRNVTASEWVIRGLLALPFFIWRALVGAPLELQGHTQSTGGVSSLLPLYVPRWQQPPHPQPRSRDDAEYQLYQLTKLLVDLHEISCDDTVGGIACTVDSGGGGGSGIPGAVCTEATAGGQKYPRYVSGHNKKHH
eukprot:TRINITY_DN418_c2_g1_i2.p1 TRINITY_DN418_c2_g1~~TRINITY_DN418_c2_g1_i2.p1  ORF type:complete len:197 (-),score=65.81 TRINITY_DN418_c2_g1_i2:77-598(-)